MVEFETLQSEEIEFGDDEFIQVARKKAVSGEGEDEFISLTRGFYTDDGGQRSQNSFAIPADRDVLEFIMEQLPKMLDDED